MDTLSSLRLRLGTLVIFRGLLRHPVLESLAALLGAPADDAARWLDCYAGFAAALYRCGDNLSDCLLEAVLLDENLCMRSAAQGLPLAPNARRCLDEELSLLEQVSRITPAMLRGRTDFRGFLPEWSCSAHDFAALYRQRLAEVGRYGYGVYAKNRAFVLENGALAPVLHPDPIRLDRLPGYGRQRRQVVDNTLALLSGRPAANILLYGDSGTGKSATVKAVVNEYHTEGLRLIELRKSQLHALGALLDTLVGNPLKFILFIDDLSFAKNDDNFAALKAVLEGSVSFKASNIAVYATSNRRHLVRESFSDREGDEIHLADTIAELTSLSERFGLTVTFERPDKEQYIEIVLALAAQNGIDLPRERLIAQAEAFALRRAGRSPRVAKQFVERLLSDR
jgi:predicted AAA+ superfamily ATPase